MKNKWKRVFSYPPSDSPNSSNRSVNASRNSTKPCAGMAIWERGPPRVIVWDTFEGERENILAVDEKFLVNFGL